MKKLNSSIALNLFFATIFKSPEVAFCSFNFLDFCRRELGLGRRQFHAGEEAKEATSEINEELHRAEESYWTVFSVKFTELAWIDLLLIQITVPNFVTSWKYCVILYPAEAYNSILGIVKSPF